MLRVLSLGAGVQSSVLLLMSCLGELPKLDAAVFADTQWEPAGVYEHLRWLEGEATKAGIPVHRVTEGNLRERVLAWQQGADDPVAGFLLPIHTKDGIMRRQCTTNYKIRPIEQCIRRKLLKLAPRKVAPVGAIELWKGITTDEAKRARASRNRWEISTYPFLGLPDDMLPKPMSRQDCLRWFKARYPGRNLPRSSCIGCPLKAYADWKDLTPAELEDASLFDDAIREYRGLDGHAFLHRSKKPLRKVDMSTAEDRGQLSLWNDECLGMCGV